MCFVGDKQKTLGSSLIFPKNCRASFNYFHDVGFYGKQTAGIFVSIAASITISSNLIHNVPRAGIVLNDGFYGGHIVEYNKIYDAVQETADHGPFNSWGRERFWSQVFNHAVAGTPASFPAGPVTVDTIKAIIVRNNHFEYYGQAAVKYASWAIDMDDGSSNFQVYDNLCVGSAVKIGAAGDLHFVENNVFVDPLFPVLFWLPMYNNHDSVCSCLNLAV